MTASHRRQVIPLKPAFKRHGTPRAPAVTTPRATGRLARGTLGAVVLVVLVAGLAAPSHAGAGPDAATLSAPGHLVITDATQLSIGQLWRAEPSGADPDPLFSVVLRPGVDYFVAPRVSIGGQLTLGYTAGGSYTGTDRSTTTLGFLGRVGYCHPLTPKLSVWMTGALVYQYARRAVEDEDPVSGQELAVLLTAPLLIHLTPNFFLGAGPSFGTTLMSTVDGEDVGKVTAIGVTSIVGGWF